MEDIASEDLLLNAPLHYPKAKEWMWSYCIYLGPFTDSKGRNYDLGVFIDSHTEASDTEVSAAIVNGNEDGNYYSGSLNRPQEHREFYIETKRRAVELGLIKN